MGFAAEANTPAKALPCRTVTVLFVYWAVCVGRK